MKSLFYSEGQKVVVESVLSAVVAADVAFSAEPASVAGPVVQVVGRVAVRVVYRFAWYGYVIRGPKGDC